MIAQLQINNKTYQVDLSKPIDISIPMNSSDSVLAWYLDHLKIAPVKMGDFVGEVDSGASVNFRNIQFNPHAHGTHTECFGHISRGMNTVDKYIQPGIFEGALITVELEKREEDLVVTKEKIQNALAESNLKTALVIRTLPNDSLKKSINYSNTNPPYFEQEAIEYLVQIGVKHLLVDLPSIDKEKDDGKLIGHKTFWNFHGNIRKYHSITEMVFIQNDIPDGNYLVSISFPRFASDASPSRILLYSLYF